MARIAIAFTVLLACNREAAHQSIAEQSASAPAASSAAPVWKPHKLSKLRASTFCAELVEGSISPMCVGGAGSEDVDVFTIPGRQRTEAHGIVVSFNDGKGSFEQWIRESLAADAGVDPVYHYNATAKMLVSFNGDVPEETKLRVAEALDAL